MKKRWILLAAIAVISLVFWYYAKPWVFEQEKFSQPEVWIVPLVALITLCSMLGLTFYLFQNQWLKHSASLITALAFLLFFGTHWLFLIAVVLLLLIHWRAIVIIKQDARERVKLHFGSTMRRSIFGIMAPFLIMLSFAYFLSPYVQASADRQELPPGFSKVINQTISLFFEKEIQQYPADQREELREQLATQVAAQLTRQAQPYFQYFPPILAFGLYLLLQGLSFIFVYISVGLSVLMFTILRKMNFITVKKTQVEAEVLEMI